MFSEVFCIVSGKVQAVGYRDFVSRLAKEHGIVGFVRNKPDDTVEILGQGYPDILKQFVEELNEGSVLAKVDGVAVDWRSPEVQFDDFQVLF